MEKNTWCKLNVSISSFYWPIWATPSICCPILPNVTFTEAEGRQVLALGAEKERAAGRHREGWQAAARFACSTARTIEFSVLCWSLGVGFLCTSHQDQPLKMKNSSTNSISSALGWPWLLWNVLLGRKGLLPSLSWGILPCEHFFMLLGAMQALLGKAGNKS